MTARDVNYLDLSDIVALGPIVLEGGLEVRDWGLIESALARPAATVFGEDAYPSVYDKAAAGASASSAYGRAGSVMAMIEIL